MSQLNEIARESLQSCFDPDIWIQGEIHGLKIHSKSGHLYFDLVEKAQGVLDGYVAKISCAFFRGPYTKWRTSLAAMGISRFELNSGIEVKIRAKVDLFVKEGRYQLIVTEIDPSFTFGAIAKKREQTIRELRTLGLLDRNKGLPFPEIPLSIGLITSEGSAAFSDFMRIIRDSGYCFSITLFDAHMQGENTVPEVIKGIRKLQDDPHVDTIVIVRGGGAKTDLFSFDDMNICKAVALCPKPVVTGIGHEIDVSVSDLVAHTYCVTPTDVARLYVAKADEVWSFLDRACQELSYGCSDILQRCNERLRMAAKSLDHVSQRWMADALSGLKGTAFRLHTAVAKDLAKREQILFQNTLHLKNYSNAVISEKLRAIAEMPVVFYRNAQNGISANEEDIRRLHRGIDDYARTEFARQDEYLDRCSALISIMDPAETLKRGYSITVDSRGKAVTDAENIREGECITTVLSKGRIKSVVTNKES